MTSSRPLSYGGFDTGIEARPETISSVLSRNGYHTIHITPVHWVNAAFGYIADTEISLYSPKALERAIGKLIRDPLTRHLTGGIDLKTADVLTRREIGRFFAILKERSASTQMTSHPSVEVQRYRWKAVARCVRRAEQRWNEDRPGFLRDAALALQRGWDWVPGLNWERLRTLSDLLELGSSRLVESAIQRWAPRRAEALRCRRRPYPDALQITDEVLRVAESRGGAGQPFFIWAHLFDAHMPYSFGEGRSWARDAHRWFHQTGHHPQSNPFAGFGPEPRDADAMGPWIACYDAAVAFIDAQLGRLREELDRRGLADTILMVSSDHGEELGEHGDTSHRFRLYEHNTRIHLSLDHPDLGRRDLPGFGSSLDIAPTIAELAGVTAPSAWEGRSFQAQFYSPREGIVLETFFGSPCDLTTRPLYMAVRSGGLKLMWCDAIDPRDRLGWQGARLFDLATDPHEQNDIAAGHPEIVRDLMAPILARKAELHSATPYTSGQNEN